MRRTLVALCIIGMLLHTCVLAQETATEYTDLLVWPFEPVVPSGDISVSWSLESVVFDGLDSIEPVTIALVSDISQVNSWFPSDTYKTVALLDPWAPTSEPDAALPCLEIVTATIDMDPEVLNLASQGKWITCYVTLPTSYNVADIDGATILLNEAVLPTWSMIDEEEQVLTLKFDRAEVQSLLLPGEVDLVITGLLTGDILFEGFDSITVIDPGTS